MEGPQTQSSTFIGAKKPGKFYRPYIKEVILNINIYV